MPTVDLHAHTNASDGEHPPQELIALAAAAGIDTIAVTDHDTMAGVSEALAEGRRMGINVVPGIELSSDWTASDGSDQTVHLLGYFCDPASAAITELAARKERSRTRRAMAMVERLGELGIDITFERVKEIAGAAQIGRPHIARAIIEKGYETNWQLVFERWLGNDAPAYQPAGKFDVHDAIGLVKAAGGLAVVAHPYYDFHNRKLDLATLLPAAVAAGLTGLEVYYGDFPDCDRDWALRYADRFDLIPTGGSDYHGPFNGSNALGVSLCPFENFGALQAAAELKTPAAMTFQSR